MDVLLRYFEVAVDLTSCNKDALHQLDRLLA
jgi:hypothetical protein